jgi:hypothetical protein
MSPDKSYIKEVAESAQAYQTARAEPMPQTEQPRQSMDFIRSLMLDIPIQTVRTDEVNENTTPVQDSVEEPQDESVDLLKKLAGIR